MANPESQAAWARHSRIPSIPGRAGQSGEKRANTCTKPKPRVCRVSGGSERRPKGPYGTRTPLLIGAFLPLRGHRVDTARARSSFRSREAALVARSPRPGRLRTIPGGKRVAVVSSDNGRARHASKRTRRFPRSATPTHSAGRWRSVPRSLRELPPDVTHEPEEREHVFQLLRRELTPDGLAEDGSVASVCQERGELDAGEHTVDVGVGGVGTQELLRGAAERFCLAAALCRCSPLHGDGRRRILVVLRDRQSLVRVASPGRPATAASTTALRSAPVSIRYTKLKATPPGRGRATSVLLPRMYRPVGQGWSAYGVRFIRGRARHVRAVSAMSDLPPVEHDVGVGAQVLDGEMAEPRGRDVGSGCRLVDAVELGGLRRRAAARPMACTIAPVAEELRPLRLSGLGRCMNGSVTRRPSCWWSVHQRPFADGRGSVVLGHGDDRGDALGCHRPSTSLMK